MLVWVRERGGRDGHVVQQAQLRVGAVEVLAEVVEVQADGEGEGAQEGVGEGVAFGVEGAEVGFEVGQGGGGGEVGVVEAAVFFCCWGVGVSWLPFSLSLSSFYFIFGVWGVLPKHSLWSGFLPLTTSAPSAV